MIPKLRHCKKSELSVKKANSPVTRHNHRGNIRQPRLLQLGSPLLRNHVVFLLCRSNIPLSQAILLGNNEQHQNLNLIVSGYRHTTLIRNVPSSTSSSRANKPINTPTAVNQYHRRPSRNQEAPM